MDTEKESGITSGSGSRKKRPLRENSESEQEQSLSQNKKRKPLSPTLILIKSFKGVVLQIMDICAEIILDETPYVEKVRRMNIALEMGIRKLEKTKEMIGERVKILEGVKGDSEPLEENSPYKMDSMEIQSKNQDFNVVITNFMHKLNTISLTASDAMNSTAPRGIFKILAINRTCDTLLPMLKASKREVESALNVGNAGESSK